MNRFHHNFSNKYISDKSFIFRVIYMVLFLNIFLVQNILTQAFITTWKTDNPGSSNSSSIIIPTYSGETYNYDVDWNNDGTFDEFGITTYATHDFGSPGTYTIRIQGTFPRIYFNNSGDKEKILSIDQWGNIVWTSMNRAFYGASNLTSNASDAPDLSLVTDLSYMFYGASSFNGDLSGWDVSNVVDMNRMFRNASSFNGDVSGWNVENVTNMYSMFYGASSFNGDVSLWDVSKVTDMDIMFYNASSFNGDVSNWNVGAVVKMNGTFYNASSFNGDISDWDVANVTGMESLFNNAVSFNGDVSGWDVSNVTTMKSMFFNANLFNSDLSSWNVASVTNMNSMFNSASSFNGDVSSWNVGNVTNMTSMFRGANSFNIDISGWNVGNVTSMDYMFYNASAFNQNLGNWDLSSQPDLTGMLDNSGLDLNNYDNTLIGWESHGVSGLTLGAYGLNYCNGETARTSLINNYGWTITGDNLDCTLPVRLLSLDGDIIENDRIRLNWSSESEKNIQRFEIQRSKDGITWETIDLVNSNITNYDIKQYSYVDKYPFNGINYYRIKQIDDDGLFEFSKIIQLYIKSTKPLSTYPNPANDYVIVEGQNLDNAKVIVTNGRGSVLLSQRIDGNMIDISNLPNGIYFISIINRDQISKFKILKNSK